MVLSEVLDLCIEKLVNARNNEYMDWISALLWDHRAIQRDGHIQILAKTA